MPILKVSVTKFQGFFDFALPSRGYSTESSQFYKILQRDPLVGGSHEKILVTKVVAHI